MKKLVIAEKPSVGREIAKNIGCTVKCTGYSEGSDWVVTWALGHLVELAEPQHYSESYRRWSLRDLPMLPETLDEEVIEETREQYAVIEKLLGRSDISSVVIATDAGREGELVARWILKMAHYEGKCERLWISSQTEKAIKEGFESLRPSEDYDNLYHAAECRAQADWYVGMNVTRALTCHYDAKLSAGRVQTPTLALMTQREDEIEKFLGSFYYSARASFGLFSASYYPQENSVRFQDEHLASDMETWKGKKGKVVSITKEEKSEEVPLAYDLTELQKDANIAYGFSAKETLDTLQRLYEVHKIVTYPRTDSRCITPDIIPTLRERIRALLSTEFSYVAEEYLKNGYREDNPRFVNAALVSDHHALLPTEQKVKTEDLSENEKKLWRLIALRFLEVIGEDYTYETTTVKMDVEGRTFLVRFTTPIRKGFRSVSQSVNFRSSILPVESDDDTTLIKTLKEGDELPIISIKVKKSSTTPPERYTDATLLSAMEHAGRFVEDSALKANLTSGLGTPATRADIIEKLVQNRYVERSGKYFIPTAKGREVVRLAPETLRSPELTGVWEGRLERISRGKEDPALFIKDIKKMASDLVSSVEKSSLVFEPKFTDTKKCPYCGRDMMKAEDSDGSVHYICQTLSCLYEERVVRTKITAPSSSSSRKTVTSDGGKVKVVIKKSPVKVVTPAVYETKVEVVRESKKKYRRDEREKGARSSSSSYSYSSSGHSDGGTMADFFRLSQERDAERKNRKKK